MDFVISFLSTPAILLGLVAMVGLLAQKKKGSEVLTGTFKTVIGFLVFSAGGTIMPYKILIHFFKRALILLESLLHQRLQQH